MTYSVAFDFEPPRDPDFAKLRIWESPTSTGSSWTLIETVTDIGTYPDYITRYETDRANSPTDYFALEWITQKDASTDLSNPIRGGTELLIAEVVNRMLLYDPSADERVAYREGEAVIEELYNIDPYTVNVEGVNYRRIQGLVYYALARMYTSTLIVTEASGSNDDYTAGLISQKTGGSSGTQTKIDLLKYLIDLANRSLGRNFTVIAVMEAVNIAGGMSTVVDGDQSRLLVEIE